MYAERAYWCCDSLVAVSLGNPGDHFFLGDGFDPFHNALLSIMYRESAGSVSS